MKWALSFYVMLCLLSPPRLVAQCISSFPYTEDFEAGNGGWTTGGTGNDWAWGQVSKSVITQAASGSNCWVTGGLTAAFYNYGERSFLQSPCFDFTTLQHPYIGFHIFWELEKTYDGCTLQYSTNGGTTWVNVGSYNNPPDCMTQNWYNTPNVTNLTGLASVKEGWTGNVQPTQGSCQGGNGSNGWKPARHCLNNLAGQPNVTFRFAFGAGTTCNSFDGIAVDDISIGEAPANTADFTYNCSGQSVSFTGVTTLCPDNLQWDFGDGTTATGLTATHSFLSAGVHQVTFTVSGPCNAPAQITKNIELLDVSATAIAVSCRGSADGLTIASVASATGPFSYNWSTLPAQTTDTAINLAPGTYQVTVSSATACPGTATATVNEPAAIVLSLTSSPDTCSVGGGRVTTTLSGGTSPYQYLWSNGNTATALSQLAAGMYSLTVTDANGCTATGSDSVGVTSGITLSFQDVKAVSCFGSNNGSATVVVHGGTAPYTYAWSNSATTETISAVAQGNYIVSVSDANQCSNTDSVVIEKASCVSYVTFPTAFSPNGDGLNETFRPKYSADLQQYTIRVYNRWGEKVYESADVNEGWNGIYQGVLQPIAVYVWVAEYKFSDGIRHTQSGNITLVR